MAKVSRDISARSYISTEPFNTDFFSYTVKKVKFQTVGQLGLVTLDASKCPAGRILRENGRKLAPGINPGVTTYMVGVYDNQSMLNGFIDPNASLFAVYSSNRPNFLVDNVEPDANVVTDKGAPVLTNGLVSAGTTVTAGLSVTAGTTVTAQKYRSPATPAGAGSTGTIGSPLTTSCGTANFNGSSIQTIYSSQITASSLVFITVNNVTPAATSVVPTTGSFIVRSSLPSDSSTFYWFIVN